MNGCGELRVVADPATIDPRFLLDEAKADRIEAAVAAARKAQKGWEARPPIERAGYLRTLHSWS